MWDEQAAEIRLSHVIIVIFVTSLVFLSIYILWKWCFDENTSESSKRKGELQMTAVYAHEIEPGIVVLQSEDGELFRILKEYDYLKNGPYGSFNTNQPRQMASNASVRSVSASSPYVPAYLTVHSQTQPSAPPAGLPLDTAGSGRSPPPYGVTY
ncbi:hypothetical protein CHS0354_042368 [Potamilus streckersoni]|uniref:Uncharacterized protein n=1 Tax=Potamilus streckersoni TaxID=2493646 RepID=A0AAE0SUX8_9BIVA|nr:hypothetical protein CHS0354_042368 [Potamilus streckersoni]